jgi:hypothetical protein
MKRLSDSISSLLPFLSSSSPTSPYSAVPLSATSSPRIGGGKESDEENDLQTTSPARRSPLATAWLYLSPLVVVVLAVLAVKGFRNDGDGIVNPYACRPAAQFTSLSKACAAQDSGIEVRSFLSR